MNDIIAQTVCVLETGGLILYPTDTVWGIGCDATNETAVQRIFQLKKRADNKSMIILSASPKMGDHINFRRFLLWVMTI